MKDTLRKLVAKISRGQKGFTLIEMIVVVGIIAVLAAVIVPNMGNFIGQGKSGAKDAEREAVQTAMNAMMAENAVDAVDPWDTASESPTNDWTDKPTGTDTAFLESYIQSADGKTTYFYCYEADGDVSKPFEDDSDTCDNAEY